MKSIQDKDDLFATIPKRHSGIYKKAIELCTLSDADVGIVIFFPNHNPPSVANTSIDSISNRSLNQNLTSNNTARVNELEQMRPL
ncbi:hypothetical protein RJ639_002254 [Escallonia herrerae]|uniref:MADS-box domain-containing protein n=1 Tax=Escallonia herrerae TaxID=1293975 RepID=A0AA88X8E3_9ASTE|nr:hypothetical protein RJ639_002254 [Escallonia herrerae]